MLTDQVSESTCSLSQRVSKPVGWSTPGSQQMQVHLLVVNLEAPVTGVPPYPNVGSYNLQLCAKDRSKPCLSKVSCLCKDSFFYIQVKHPNRMRCLAPRQNIRGTVGLPTPGMHLRVVDPESLRDVPDGTAGLILAKGPGVTAGYWANEQTTAQAFRAGDGWYDTGEHRIFPASTSLTCEESRAEHALYFPRFS